MLSNLSEFYARLHNVTVGDDCYIDRIHNYIANYEIGDNVFIENTNLIVVDGETSFEAMVNKEKRGKCIGNGWTVDVIAHILTGLKESVNK